MRHFCSRALEEVVKELVVVSIVVEGCVEWEYRRWMELCGL